MYENSIFEEDVLNCKFISFYFENYGIRNKRDKEALGDIVGGVFR